ncbi:hypothetical protein AVEN_100928-1 [Araneus ventricosus]|uniref:Uncharacterized protein n=1 Tax=Araneus ventricosus TaxID=182803 RepID=A0A4Y2AVK5_ARAVE|nr:hypothetical protein AVEN_100928-1 [Araneus ventricosus]
MADKIGETTASAAVIGEVVAASFNMLETRVEEMTNQAQHLSMDLSRHHARRRSSKSRTRARSLSDPSNTNCWYHTRFVNKARKCVKPRSFSENFKNR